MMRHLHNTGSQLHHFTFSGPHTQFLSLIRVINKYHKEKKSKAGSRSVLVLQQKNHKDIVITYENPKNLDEKQERRKAEKDQR